MFSSIRKALARLALERKIDGAIAAQILLNPDKLEYVGGTTFNYYTNGREEKDVWIRLTNSGSIWWVGSEQAGRQVSKIMSRKVAKLKAEEEEKSWRDKYRGITKFFKVSFEEINK